jgi:HAD superfamily hydrolase (TIGR01484 family)
MKPKIVFSDFDGTLTLGESLSPILFDIIDLLSKNNIKLVPVSGRSISWGHFFLTHFPIETVIMEGGGVIGFQDQKGLIDHQFLIDDKEIARLGGMALEVRKEFRGLALTADSIGRITDRAIELSLLSELGVKSDVEKFMDEHGVNHSCSNVHLNFWCGEISKIKAIKYYLSKFGYGVKLDDCLFFGDSLNDATVFGGMPNTVGVSNISLVLNKIEHRPKVILEGPENAGPKGVLSYLSNVLK